MNRWIVYQRERFPLAAHAPLVAAFSTSAVCFSSLARGHFAVPHASSLFVAFATSLLFFLQLRIADEIKDADDDARFRPYRPVPRGLVSLAELKAIGFATAAAGLVAVTFMRSWQDLDLLFVITLPLFLFSGTFFPISTYPEPLRILVELSPLYRGVDLVRGMITGVIGVAQVIDVIYLFVMGMFFVWVASRRMGKMLLK